MFEKIGAHWGLGIADMIANRPIAAAMAGTLLVIAILLVVFRSTRVLGQAIETEELISER